MEGERRKARRMDLAFVPDGNCQYSVRDVQTAVITYL